MTPLDEFYLTQKEPLGGCLMALRDLILAYDESMSERWYYRLPCFFYKEKICSYLWIDKKTQQPYIAFYPGVHLTHPLLEQGNRTQSKILRIHVNEDIPLESIYEILDESINTASHFKA